MGTHAQSPTSPGSGPSTLRSPAPGLAPPPARPRLSCRVPRTRVSPAQPSPPPPPAPRSHGAGSPPAPSLFPTSLGPTLPSFVPGAPSRFPQQPRLWRREPPPRSCRSQPQPGAQVGGGRGPGSSRSPGLRVGAGAGCEGGADWGRGGPGGTGLGCGLGER